MAEKKLTALQMLKARLTGAPKAPNANETKSQNQVDLGEVIPDNAPKPSGYAYEPDLKEVQKSILELDFVGGAKLIDDNGTLDSAALNGLLQKVAYQSAVAATAQANDALTGYDSHSTSRITAMIGDHSKSQALQGEQYSKDPSTQKHALLYRDSIALQFPNATASELNDITREYLATESPEPEETNKGKPEIAPIEETNWATELGIDLEPETTPAVDAETTQGAYDG